MYVYVCNLKQFIFTQHQKIPLLLQLLVLQNAVAKKKKKTHTLTEEH